MRIVYATDIHGSFKALQTLLEATHADLYLIAGDLVEKQLRSFKNFFRFCELESHFTYLKCRARTEIPTRSFVNKLLQESGTDKEEKALARQYRRLHKLAQKTIHEYMTELEGIFASFSDKKILVLPGNYDINLEETALAKRNLHKRVHPFDDIIIAGYGGANITTPGIPEDLKVPFVEYQDGDGGRLYSEPREILCDLKPDIAVVHQPPYGYFDLLRSYGHLGSIGIRDFIDQLSPQVVLCGHMHENWGVLCADRTVVINPSNFGYIPDISGTRRGGYFFEFILENKTYHVGTLRQLHKKKIYDLADYPLSKKGAIQPLIIDAERIKILSREKAASGQVIKQIRDFREVRDFYRRYETEATRQRIQGLRRVYRQLRSQGEELAFDILGSVNFGMSEPNSDVDLVIYRRCACKHPLPETACTLPRALWECFQSLESKYHIDVTDCVNLEKVETSILAEDAECPALQRFVLYRAICRPVNLRLIKQTENLLLERPLLKKKVEYFLKENLKMMVLAHSHIQSFKKYESRLHDQGINLPPNIQKKLHEYLGERG